MTDRRACACACGCGKCADRRQVLGWLAGGVAFVQLGPATAQSDLLDPDKVGKASATTKGPNADDLLDIDAVKSPRPSAAAKEEVGTLAVNDGSSTLASSAQVAARAPFLPGHMNDDHASNMQRTA